MDQVCCVANLWVGHRLLQGAGGGVRIQQGLHAVWLTHRAHTIKGN